MSDHLDRLNAALTDRYTLERQLGQGGMATVYLAHDVKHDRKVALKVMRPELAAVIGAERFLAEIKTTAHLQHPHILPLHDSGEAGHSVFYVMPYVEGESLRDRLNRDKQLPIEDAVRIAREVASALDYAHRHGVVHRDIKPENILLHEGQALVADFGIALALSRSDGGTRMTETGMSLGTPHYMSPEQAMGQREITPRSDVYALGCVVYEMLSGDPPFTGSTPQAIVAQVLTGQPRGLTIQRHTIPPHVEAAVFTALEKLPADRFASAAAFGDALGNAAFRPATPTGLAASPGAPVSRWKRLTAGFAGSAAVLAVLLAAQLLRPPEGIGTRGVVRVGFRLAESEGLRALLDITSVALAPDGSGLIYSGVASGAVPQLWLRRWNGFASTPIRGTEGGCCVAFSPDGRSVAFIATPPALKVVSLDGGLPVTVVDSGLANHVSFGGGVAWGPDGMLYVSGAKGLVRVPAGGGTLETISRLDPARGELVHAWPDVLPNGKGALVTLVPRWGQTREMGIAAVNFATGAIELLARGAHAQYMPPGYVVFVQEGGLLMAAPFDQARLRMTGPAVALADTLRAGIGRTGNAAFAVSSAGILAYVRGTATETRLAWVDRTGRETPMEPEWKGDLRGPALSPDGRRLIISDLSAGVSHLWLRDIGGGSPVRVTFDGSLNDRAAWTHDGMEVFWVSNQGGQAGIFRRRVDGTAVSRQIAVADPRPMFGHWASPDGRWVLVRSDDAASGAGDILGVRPGVDSVPRTFVATPAREYAPTISPDGRWLAYASDESGRFEIYVRPFPETDQARWQISTAGGSEPLWSRNGRELFYRDGSQALVAAEILPGSIFQPGRQVKLFSAAPYATHVNQRAYDVTSDGQRFLMLRFTEPVSDRLVVVFNWIAELKAKTAR